jgi:methionyl-tRNA synthetase
LAEVRFYLTTPIYYVNATPHIGHAYTTIVADVLARHHRLRGDETFFLTGTDEHGTNIPRRAAEAGLEVKDFVDRNAAAFQEMTERIGASNDFFIRTTDPRHEAAVQEFVRRIYDGGDIYEGVYAGLYCPRCEAFYTEAELIDGKCPVHGIEPERVEEKNWFFRLSAYQERLLALYDENPSFVLPRFRYNEARSFIEQGLDDISVSRSSEQWGVRVPWDPEQTVYVWVDALINYWSALAFAREGEDLRDELWPEVRHLLAKDILKFHCVIWPALLLAAGLDVPRQLFVHGYLLFAEEKMSKSLGNVIDPLDLIDVFGSADPLRFYVLREVQFGQDGNVSVDGVQERYERELANDLGNLVSRTTAMIARYREGRLTESPATHGATGGVASLGRETAELLDVFDVTGALDRIWKEIRGLNALVEERKPWELAKDDSRAEELDRTLYELADGLRTVAVALLPYLPATAPRILEALKQPAKQSWDDIAPGRTLAAEGIEPAAPLFPRFEAPSAAA